MPPIRFTMATLVALTLGACAGNPFGATPEAAPAPKTDMGGRWILATPNAPSCGMNFTAAASEQEGAIAPEGGCPGKFFTSRHWTLEHGALTINDHQDQPLARLTFANGHFEGKAIAGMPVTLSRASPAG
jgi:Protease inhibitor Inh